MRENQGQTLDDKINNDFRKNYSEIRLEIARIKISTHCSCLCSSPTEEVETGG